MNQISPIQNLLLRFIAVVYLLLFFFGLVSSGYLLAGIIAIKPILLIGFLKYVLLCVLFFVLLIYAVKALTLNLAHLKRLRVSTGNFKWLFTIAILICIAAKIGWFSLKNNNNISISILEIAILIVMTIFCFWSDRVLIKQEIDFEENLEK